MEPVRIGGGPGKGFEPLANASQQRFCFGTSLGIREKEWGLTLIRSTDMRGKFEGCTSNLQRSSRQRVACFVLRLASCIEYSRF